MAGDVVIVIDNCERPIEGDFLCSMLTQETVRPRILGKSEVARVPTRCLVIATGNNLVLSGDVSRRVLVCRLDAKAERPDLIQHSFDPRNEAKANRADLVIAALTILRAFIAADKPLKLDRIGSFEQWNLVREALVWLGKEDPAKSRDRLLADDPVRSELVDLLKLWRGVLDDKRLTMIELDTLAEKQATGPLTELVAALVARTRFSSFNRRSVGKFLSKQVDRIAGGYVLRSYTDSSGTRCYWVNTADKTTGEAPADNPPS